MMHNVVQLNAADIQRDQVPCHQITIEISRCSYFCLLLYTSIINSRELIQGNIRDAKSTYSFDDIKKSYDAVRRDVTVNVWEVGTWDNC